MYEFITNSWKQKKKFVREFQKFVHKFWMKKVICVQIWTNQLDCIKTEIQRHHLLVIIHSPREIISTMCKTGQDALRKRKACGELFIHISNKSASNKLKNVSMESSKLLCLDGTSFCSKSCKLKTIPLSIASMLTFVVAGPRLWGLKVIFFNFIC